MQCKFKSIYVKALVVTKLITGASSGANYDEKCIRKFNGG